MTTSPEAWSPQSHHPHRIIGTRKEELVGVGVPFHYDIGVVLSPWDMPSWGHSRERKSWPEAPFQGAIRPLTAQQDWATGRVAVRPSWVCAVLRGSVTPSRALPRGSRALAGEILAGHSGGVGHAAGLLEICLVIILLDRANLRLTSRSWGLFCRNSPVNTRRTGLWPQGEAGPSSHVLH